MAGHSLVYSSTTFDDSMARTVDGRAVLKVYRPEGVRLDRTHRPDRRTDPTMRLLGVSAVRQSRFLSRRRRLSSPSIRPGAPIWRPAAIPPGSCLAEDARSRRAAVPRDDGRTRRVLRLWPTACCLGELADRLARRVGADVWSWCGPPCPSGPRTRTAPGTLPGVSTGASGLCDKSGRSLPYRCRRAAIPQGGGRP